MPDQSPFPPTASRRWWLLVVVVVLAAGGLWLSAQRRADIPSVPIVIGGGRPQLLEFGMGICEQCQKMQPVMARATAELGDAIDVHVLDIRNPANEELGNRFGLRMIPLVVLVDGAGRERWRHTGFVDFEGLATAVRQNLQDPGAACTRGEERCEP